MIDHIGIGVSDYGVAKTFYTRALRPIGYELLLEFGPEVTDKGPTAGFGAPPKPDFWIGGGRANLPPVHVAFQVASRAQVDGFYRSAAALSPQLLRRVRARSGWSQHRGRVPRGAALSCDRLPRRCTLAFPGSSDVNSRAIAARRS
jgi:hypothetical protein